MAGINKMKVRNVKFDFTDITDTHYASGNIFSTHFTNALHVVFPEGEKLFIKSVKNFYNEVHDPVLKMEMKDFMSQEAIHHREHERFWEQLEQMGLNPEPFAGLFKKTTDFFERFFYLILPKRTAHRLMLSMTAGMEHYTALFGNQMLGNIEFAKQSLPKEMLMLMLWHSAEELEHKSVAYNVFQKVDGSYAMRMLGMILSSILFYLFAFGGMTYFIIRDKNRNLSTLHRQFIDFVVNFSAKPEGAEGWKLFLDYFKPGFHPDDHDNYHLAEDFFKEYKARFESTIMAKVS